MKDKFLNKREATKLFQEWGLIDMTNILALEVLENYDAIAYYGIKNGRLLNSHCRFFLVFPYSFQSH